MLFNSGKFLIFLPVVLIAYFLLNRLKLTLGAKFWLILASLFFYASFKTGNSFFIAPLILIFSIVVNFALGKVLSGCINTKLSKKAAFITGIVFNILFLGFFKYTEFFISGLNELIGLNLPVLNVIVPVGVSFFTFIQIAYLFDCRDEKIKNCSFSNYLFFVSFFPYITSGPIVHYLEVMPQFQKLRNKIFNWKNFSEGFYLFTLGLFKKIAIADILAQSANLGYANSLGLSFFEGWFVALCYTFQIYYDFSGYTDMALGIGKMFNIKLPDNFNNPYISQSVQDFWRRWHITLSRFLRDYLYFPLGGSRNKQAWRTYFNVMVVFLVCGLWHGANVMFIFWGAAHGAGLCINRLWAKTNIKLPPFVYWLLTFGFLNFSWVLFRAADIQIAKNIFRAMLGFGGFYLPQFHGMDITFKNPLSSIDHLDLSAVILLAILVGVIFVKKDFKTLKTNAFYLTITVIMLFSSLLLLFRPNYSASFLYFNF